ncbi:molybdenum cofactor biosynthesis protein MoaE [Arcticibacter tournemirensis]|uniref:Molybdopterin synthase catalytic subunit n=1 Tax=Arcticibacter tournemirensis TaxID=699437 RepID=A0A4Q0M3Y2_9SPHI|nr:molybdenum cofactor biosynthesis protein MoaE [Arcticibacter tournemirensis]RXF67648.1 molybdenum cofactor biosynthesis protein MoaE [Arcticibacter tournemirensis]
MVEIVEQININKAYRHLQANGAGGINVFVGTVRDHANGKTVVGLEFEAYVPMALKEMKRIAELACEKWPLERVVIQHVTGMKEPGEVVVVTGASSAHRDASFEACRFLIDELKKSVPIWKKEYYEDNSIWVNAHP